MRRWTTIVLTMGMLLLGAARSDAQTAAERCLTMRLSLLGSTLSNSLGCHAWSVATRTEPSDACLAHGEQRLAQQLRSSGCATEAEIADLLERARDATALLVDAQTADGRVAEFENTHWRTEVITDLGRVYAPGMAWPDESCRASGYCAGLMIFVCQTTVYPDGRIETLCDTVLESSSPSFAVPVITTENIALPTGEILSRGSVGSGYEVVITMTPDGSSFKGAGHVDSTAIFLTGERVP